MSEEDRDLRRKLEPLDRQRIHFGYWNNSTIRELANTYGVSTKYIKRIVTKSGEAFTSEECSGCGYTFSHSGLILHYAIWTSGFTHPLACMVPL